jgi:GH15 family glucan-1,4-alpha-glucosidase
MTQNDDFGRIEDYFVIGDLRTAALVSDKGSIDWLCLPYFDSPSVFGKLLDPAAGCLAIDMPDHEITGGYIENTAIVEFQLSDGRRRITIRDFMVPLATKAKASQQLVSSICVDQGETNVNFKFQPRPEYASKSPKITQNAGRLELKIDHGIMILHLPDNVSLNKKEDFYQISIPVKAGRPSQLVIEYVPEGKRSTKPAVNLEAKTAEFWHNWVSKGKYFDFCRGRLIRSAITLKLMQFYPTGALVAAPTTSLPEEIGGVRNWDYRYVWIRDATFALYSFYVLGYDEEAEHFFSFIEKVTEKCADKKFDVSLMYTIWGGPVPREKSLSNLSGYINSSPVRVGNDAAKQFQLDVYGAIIDAFYFASKRGLIKVSKSRWRQLILQLLNKIDDQWQKPDHGIWEARVGTKHYTYSKVMAWVGADRVKRLKEPLGLSEDEMMTCSRLSDSIKEWIWQNGYQDGNLRQYPETKAVDATNLLFVLLQFLDKHDPKTKDILQKTAKELSHQEAFVYRYLKDDGLPGKEGAFLLCSFWLISALAILEEVRPAIKLFKKLEEYMKPHGLLSEELDLSSGNYLGNYPQTFSHMGFIMSAHYINKYAKRKNIKL